MSDNQSKLAKFDLIDTSNPELLRLLFNSPEGGVVKQNLTLMMNIQTQRRVVKDAWNKFLILQGWRRSFIKRLRRYLRRKFAANAGGYRDEFIPKRTLDILNQIKAKIDQLAEKMQALFQLIVGLQKDMQCIQREMADANSSYEHDIAAYRYAASLAMADLFQLSPAYAHLFYPNDELADFWRGLDIDLGMLLTDQNETQEAHITEMQVIRLLNVIAGLQHHPEKLQELGLPKLSHADQAEAQTILRDFRSHQLYESLFQVWNLCDKKIAAREKQHARVCSEYEAKVHTIQESLDKCIHDLNDFERDLEHYEAEYQEIAKSEHLPCLKLSQGKAKPKQEEDELTDCYYGRAAL